MKNAFNVLHFLFSPVKVGAKTFFFIFKNSVEVILRICNIYVLLTFLTAAGLLVITSFAATLAGYILGGVAIAIVEILIISRNIFNGIDDALGFSGISVQNPIPRHTVFDEMSVLVEKNPFSGDRGLSTAFRVLLFYLSKDKLCKVMRFFRAIRICRIFIYLPLSPLVNVICHLPHEVNKYQIWFQVYPEIAFTMAYPLLFYLWIAMVTKPLWWHILKRIFAFLVRLTFKRLHMAKYLHEFVDRIEKFETRKKKKKMKRFKNDKNKYELLESQK